jgi:hypothetical protein
MAQDMAQMMQGSVVAANAHAAAVGLPAPPVPIPPVPPTPLALLPGAAFTASLDYNKSGELKLFGLATTSMLGKFSLKEERMRAFLGNLKEHARTYNWQDINSIPDSGGFVRSLITNYGQLMLANVNAHAAAYVDT